MRHHVYQGDSKFRRHSLQGDILLLFGGISSRKGISGATSEKGKKARAQISARAPLVYIVLPATMKLFMDFSKPHVGDVSVDLSGGDIGMAEEHLHRTNVSAIT